MPKMHRHHAVLPPAQWLTSPECPAAPWRCRGACKVCGCSLPGVLRQGKTGGSPCRKCVAQAAGLRSVAEPARPLSPTVHYACPAPAELPATLGASGPLDVQSQRTERALLQHCHPRQVADRPDRHRMLAAIRMPPAAARCLSRRFAECFGACPARAVAPREQCRLAANRLPSAALPAARHPTTAPPTASSTRSVRLGLTELSTSRRSRGRPWP